MRFIGAIILTALAVGGFILFTNPLYADIKELKEEITSLDTALTNARKLRDVQDELLARYNQFTDSDLASLEKMIPDSADNIRLIIEVQKLALSYGLELNNVNFDVPTEGGEPQAFVSSAQRSQQAQERPYGTMKLDFFAQGRYSDFVAFLEALERSLRIVDITLVKFTASDLPTNGEPSDEYRYQFTISTYWLKNS